MTSPVRCAVIGYGPLHNFGWAHCAWISHTPDLELAAVCDLDPARTEAARAHWPGIATYASTAELYPHCEVDLVSLVTPHFTHCALAKEAFAAGKHVVVEKAMCLNVAEATEMMEAAQAAGRTLAVHHNRRHDGNYRTLARLVWEGAIGHVFQVDVFGGGHGNPAHGWYSDKAKSGGAFYFWGPHAVDWVLNLVPGRIRGVTGFFHKLVWEHVTNEDQTRALLQFENGCVADITWSHLCAAPNPLWRVLGTKGAVVDTGANATPGYEHQVAAPAGGSLTLIQVDETGRRREQQVPYEDCDWYAFWQDLADHLVRGGPVPVSGEEGRRVIGVLEAAERSALTGQTVPPLVP